MQETEWWKTKDRRLCPVLYGCAGGWVTVMPRIVVLDVNDTVNYDHFAGLPFETKPINYGFYRNRLVLLDYGS